jgi:coenzyme F420-0:L-glutamate ligase/coenzyme F420-1:gamma-L-glutamate ligase
MPTAPTIVMTALPDMPLIQPGDDIAALIVDASHKAKIIPLDGDVYVIAQKIVSKAEDRYVDLAGIMPGARAQELAAATGKDPRLVEVILSESDKVVKFRENVLIVAHRLGFVMANAGVDQSNIPGSDDGRVLLLPRDPDASCAAIARRLKEAFAATVGVVMNDSFGRAWRNGVVGIAIGVAGIPAIESRIGTPDLYGRRLRMTEVAVADEIAAAASLLMGQAAEARPVIHMRGLTFDGAPSQANALVRPKATDLFR